MVSEIGYLEDKARMLYQAYLLRAVDHYDGWLREITYVAIGEMHRGSTGKYFNRPKVIKEVNKLLDKLEREYGKVEGLRVQFSSGLL